MAILSCPSVAALQRNLEMVFLDTDKVQMN
jgi:hypothetical protein